MLSGCRTFVLQAEELGFPADRYQLPVERGEVLNRWLSIVQIFDIEPAGRPI